MPQLAASTRPAPSKPGDRPRTLAEESFVRGLDCLERRSFREAAARFQEAIDRDQEASGLRKLHWKYVSFLGLALTMADGRSEEGRRLCESAARREFADSDIWCNLGLVYMRLREKKLAFDAFYRGLRLRPSHRRLREELGRYERRGIPVFPRLDRNSFLNVLGGRIRARMLKLLGRIRPATEEPE